MKIYDISQEVFSCKVYPDDPIPQKQIISSVDKGDMYNLTAFSMCAHNGTHIDAPFHFINGGYTVDEIPLYVFIGDCYVARHDGELKRADAVRILKKASRSGAHERILLSGNAVVIEESARVFADAGIKLLGNESQTVGPEESPMEVHKILLSGGVVLLEGIRLDNVPEGVYFLNCAPLNLFGSDGSPCRAVLIEK